MLSTILGFSAFGLAARFGQLAIQRRPLLSSEFLEHKHSQVRKLTLSLNFHPSNDSTDPTGHVLAAMTFGTLGYFEYHWELRADELIALKREEIAQKRKERMNIPPEV